MYQQIHHHIHVSTNTPPSPFTQPNIHLMAVRSKVSIFKPKLYTSTLIHKEPDYVYKALQDPKWFTTMKKKYITSIKNDTQSLVLRTTYHIVVCNKWVYRVKYNTDGSLAKYKIKLVAKGFQQVVGVNYFGICSTVIKPATIRVV